MFAFDPALAAQLDTAEINTVVLKIPWEPLAPGPVGEYVAVVDETRNPWPDADEPAEPRFPPVDLDHPFVLAADGLTPSDGNPQFHQQMLYAVAMWTIGLVENALGRQVHWAQPDDMYRPRLGLFPHSEANTLNAFYDNRGCYFGYGSSWQQRSPGGKLVFACLGQDVVAHVVTHAIVDALQPQFFQAEILDTWAFVEGLADTLALLERFDLRNVLCHYLASARGDLAACVQLGILGQQLGEGLGLTSGVRSILGERGEDGVWRRRQPDPEAYKRETESHARGAILAGAIFDALTKIYRARTADLFRIASEGSGVLPQGDLHADLVNRLAEEAAKSARQVLDMCLRALDYCPPVGLTFGDYLRAVLTADADLVPDDPLRYRLAFIEAFRRHGIFPDDVATLSMETLLWSRPSAREPWVQVVQRFVQESLGRDCAPWGLPRDRETLYRLLQEKARELEQVLRDSQGVRRLKHIDLRRPFAVQSIWPRHRAGPNGESLSQWVIQIVQETGSPDAADRSAAGSTLLVDADTGLVRYAIHKQTGRARTPAAKDPLDGIKVVSPGQPHERRLRVFAFDPSMALQLETAAINQVTLRVPWEQLERGPIGEYLEVIDYDPATGCFYEPADLNNKYLIAQDGYAPSQGVPQFHQQMVYAVAMRTIRNFERSLGRLALWAPAASLENQGEGGDRRQAPAAGDFVQRLRLYPHAMREANAYYSSEKSAILFGYFQSSSTPNASPLTVFTCLSHDIIAHEVTHALLDGMHRSFSRASNPDMLAFHEAFADLVALFQHFSLPDVLVNQIANTRGDLASQNRLGELAMEFGSAIGNHGALRSAIGEYDEKTGRWQPLEPDPEAYMQEMEPHSRGALLVATVFDAFLTIYRSRIGDLFRIATRGTGVLPAGELQPDLVRRLAAEAAASAQDVLEMCIRALDYCPPVNLTFGDYLRAIVTADFDFNPIDERNRRVAFIEAFRRRGIVPGNVRAFSLEGLLWERAAEPPKHVKQLLREALTRWTNQIPAWNLSGKRHELFQVINQMQEGLNVFVDSSVSSAYLGLDNAPQYPIEVRSLHPTMRVDWQGTSHFQWIVEIVQDKGDSLTGATLVIDGEDSGIRYNIRKSTAGTGGTEPQAANQTVRRSLYANYFGDEGREPFAALHRF